MSTDIHTIADRRRAAEALASVVGAEILTLKIKECDDRLVNEVHGFVLRCAAQSGAHKTDYVISRGTTVLMAGSSKDGVYTETWGGEESQNAAAGFDDDAAAGSDKESNVDEVADDRVESGAAGLGDVGHGLHDLLARIEAHLVDVVANTKKSVPHTIRVDRGLRDGLTLRDDAAFATGAVSFAAHDSSPVVGDAGAPSVGAVEVTPAVLRAVAGFISDSGVVYDVVRILKHLAIDLELQSKAGAR